jgi:hypothetical protein
MEKAMNVNVRKVSYYALKMSDVPGEGARLLRLLRKHRVNLLGLSAFPRDRGSQVDLIPEDKDRLLALEEQFEWPLSTEKKAFLVQGPHETGALLPALERLSRVKINVTAMQAAIGTKARFGALLFVKPADYERAARALEAT